MRLVSYGSNHIQIPNNFFPVEQSGRRITLYAIECNLKEVLILCNFKAFFCCADINDVSGKVFCWIFLHHLPYLVNVKRNLRANVFTSGCSTENQLMTVATTNESANTKLTCLIYAILS